MCGIVGVIGYLNNSDEVRFKDMLLVGQLRGTDGCGIFGVKSGGKVEAYKTAKDPATFLATKKVTDAFLGNNQAFIGHNRAATAGVISDDNSHPFKEGKIIGVHNGTILNQEDLSVGSAKEFAVDSNAIFHSINTYGIEWTWKNLQGAAALVWYNSEEKSINLIRNSQRPLHVAVTDDNKLFIMSEAGMLRMMLCRDGRQYNPLSGFKVYSLTPDILYTFKNLTNPTKLVEEKKEDGTVEKVRKMNCEAKKLEPCKIVSYNSAYYYSSTSNHSVSTVQPKPRVLKRKHGDLEERQPYKMVVENITWTNTTSARVELSVLLGKELVENFSITTYPTLKDAETIAMLLAGIDCPVVTLPLRAIYNFSGEDKGSIDSTLLALALEEAVVKNYTLTSYLEEEEDEDEKGKCDNCFRHFNKEDLLFIGGGFLCSECATQIKMYG